MLHASRNVLARSSLSLRKGGRFYGIRPRVYRPPRAFVGIMIICITLTQQQHPGDSNSGDVQTPSHTKSGNASWDFSKICVAMVIARAGFEPATFGL